MGHLLESVNPIAAAMIGRENDPLPEIGTMVHYRPRPTDVKRGRTAVPAIVLWINQDRTLELLVIHDAHDQINQERVPESPSEHERGWTRIPSQAVAGASNGSEVATLRAEMAALSERIWGQYELEDESLAEAVQGLDDRIAKLEKATVKRPRGRPAKAKAAAKPTIIPDAA